MLVSSISLFPTMFSSLRKANFNSLVTFILSSANAFNLDLSKILAFGKELKVQYWQCLSTSFHPFPHDKVLVLCKLKTFADNNFNLARILQFLFDRAENSISITSRFRIHHEPWNYSFQQGAVFFLSILSIRLKRTISHFQ